MSLHGTGSIAERRYEELLHHFEKLDSKAAGELGDLVGDLADEREHIVLARHGRQISRMISGELYTPEGCSAECPEEEGFEADLLEAVRMMSDDGTRIRIEAREKARRWVGAES
jgi:hypothetical protein